IHDAESGGGAGDAKPERENRDRREAGRAGETTEDWANLRHAWAKGRSLSRYDTAACPVSGSSRAQQQLVAAWACWSLVAAKACPLSQAAATSHQHDLQATSASHQRSSRRYSCRISVD